MTTRNGLVLDDPTDQLPHGISYRAAAGAQMVLTRDTTKTASGKITPELYKEATAEGLTPTQYLEKIDPTPEGEAGDAFLRQCAIRGFRLRSSGNKYEQEYAATTVKDFRDAAPALFPELMRRIMARASADPYAFLQQRFYASNSQVSELLSPPRFEAVIRATTPVRRSRLADIVAIREVTTQCSWKKIYVDSDPAGYRASRHADGAELPVIQMETVREVDGETKSFGFQIRWTDKVEQCWTLPLMEWHIGQAVAQAEVDKEDEAVNILVAGDGSPNSGSVVVPISTLRGGHAGLLEAKPLIHFLLQWNTEGRYVPSTVVAEEPDLVELAFVNFGTSNLPFLLGQQAMFQNVLPSLNTVSVPSVWVSNANAATGQIMFVDGSAALRMNVLQGSPLQETDRLIERRTNVATYSEDYGFDWLLPRSVKSLDYLN